jgi:hypothetical protein
MGEIDAIGVGAGAMGEIGVCGTGAAGLAPMDGNLPGLGAPDFCAKGNGAAAGPGEGGFCGVTGGRTGVTGLAGAAGAAGITVRGATAGSGAGVGTTGGGGGGATGLGGAGAAATGSGAAGVAAGADTAASFFILNFGPKILVTSSGTSTFLCERRASNAGFIAARIAGNGSSTMTSSWLPLSAKVPGGTLARNCPKGIRTLPVDNCSTAVWAGKWNVTPPVFKARLDRLPGNFAAMAVNGMPTVSCAPTGGPE